MVIGTKQLLKLVRTYRLVEDLDERELKNPEGAGFDLRLAALYEFTSGSFLGTTHRETPSLKEIASFQPGAKKQTIVVVKPGAYYLAKTVERVNMPTNLLGIIKPRTTLFRGGVTLSTGFLPPGYRGELHFGFHNAGNQPFEIEIGARIAHVVFFEISGESVRMYEGQWQGGRGTTKQSVKGLEKQI